MSENNYGALMLKSALAAPVNLTTITEPGVYPVNAGNVTSPNLLAGELFVTSQSLRSFISITGEHFRYINNGWVRFGGSASLDVGTTDNTVAAGNDSRIVNAVPNTTKINGHALNTDASLTAEDVGALPTVGGEVTGPVKFKNNSAGYPVTLEGGSPTILFSETDTGKKYYQVVDGVGIRLQEDDTGSGKNVFGWDGSTFSTGGGISAVSSLEITGQAPMITMGESDTGKKIMLVMDGSSIRLQEDNTAGREIFSWSTHQGALSTAGTFNASILYESGSRVYSPRNPQPQQDLSPYATTAWANIDLRNDIYNWVRVNFPSDTALGAQGSGVLNGTFIVPTGCTMTGWYTEGQNPGGDTIFYRPVQKKVNGTWYTVGHSG